MKRGIRRFCQVAENRSEARETDQSLGAVSLAKMSPSLGDAGNADIAVIGSCIPQLSVSFSAPINARYSLQLEFRPCAFR
jgi:hypothetical protein